MNSNKVFLSIIALLVLFIFSTFLGTTESYESPSKLSQNHKESKKLGLKKQEINRINILPELTFVGFDSENKTFNFGIEFEHFIWRESHPFLITIDVTNDYLLSYLDENQKASLVIESSVLQTENGVSGFGTYFNLKEEINEKDLEQIGYDNEFIKVVITDKDGVVIESEDIHYSAH